MICRIVEIVCNTFYKVNDIDDDSFKKSILSFFESNYEYEFLILISSLIILFLLSVFGILSWVREYQ
jgi:hypothetical protein